MFNTVDDAERPVVVGGSGNSSGSSLDAKANDDVRGLSM
jgi:hypothetical protein